MIFKSMFWPGLNTTAFFPGMIQNNKATVQIMVYWQKWQTRRVPLHKPHFTCAPRKFLSETLDCPDLGVRETRISACSCLRVTSSLRVFMTLS